MQLVLADSDRWIRTDRTERDVGGNIVGQRGVDIGEAERCSIAADEIERTLVHVDGPDGCVR